MNYDIYDQIMLHAELFGQPVLITDQRIPRVMVPDGWFCYDMRGTDQTPDAYAFLADYSYHYHNATVLSPKSLKEPANAFRQINRGDYSCFDEKMYLETFCKKYHLALPTCPKMDEALENALLDECFRRWYTNVEDDPSLSEGTGFGKFFREMSFELLTDDEFMENYYKYIAPMDEPSF